MNTKPKKMTAIALGIGAMMLAGTLIAGSHNSGTDTDRNDVQKEYPLTGEQRASVPYLTAKEVAETVETQGYTNINKIELEKGKYEVEARDIDGKRVELDVDPRTGEVLSWKYDE